MDQYDALFLGVIRHGVGVDPFFFVISDFDIFDYNILSNFETFFFLKKIR